MPDESVSGSADSSGPDSTGPSKNSRRRPRRQDQRVRGNRRPGMKYARTFAAVDLGTNNCRLLIARETRDGFRVIDSYSKVVRLGHDLAHTGELAQESMDAAVEALKVCARKIKAKHVKRWRCVATEACRRASNGDAFLERVRNETGIALDVISPRVESRLAVMGCMKLIDKTKDVALVIDIGGGSTELSWVDVRKLREDGPHKINRPPISAWCSLPLGVVTLSDKIPEHDDREKWYGDLKQAVRDAIKEQGGDTRFVRAFQDGRGHLIGTSGTITSLAGIHLKLPYYQRDKVDGLWLRSHDAVTVARSMASRSQSERALEPCIGNDRAKMLVAGCAIIDVICEMWPSKMIRVADRGLREGMLIGLIGAKSPKVDKPDSSGEPDKTAQNDINTRTEDAAK